MQKVHSTVTSQGRVSVPAAVRRFLHLTPGSELMGSHEGDCIVVERVKRHTSAEVHRALFTERVPTKAATHAPAKSLAELKQGIRERSQRRHGGL